MSEGLPIPETDIQRYRSAFGILGQFAPEFVEYAYSVKEDGDSATIRGMMRAEGFNPVDERDLVLSWGVHMLDGEAARSQWDEWIKGGRTTVDDIAGTFFRLAEAGLV